MFVIVGTAYDHIMVSYNYRLELNGITFPSSIDDNTNINHDVVIKNAPELVMQLYSWAGSQTGVYISCATLTVIDYIDYRLIIWVRWLYSSNREENVR